jgi:hypothetical protein
MHTLRQRLIIIGPGLALGSLLALCLAASLLPASFDPQGGTLMWTWVVIVGGPVLDAFNGYADTSSVTALGWLGLLLIPAHPARPHWATGLVTAIGLLLWFFVGYFAALMALWGA